MKIDINAHIIPPKYREYLYKTAPSGFYIQNVVESLPTLFDLDARFRILDKFEGLMQVLTLSAPAPEMFANPEQALELSRRANDEMAELLQKYPDRFPAAVATVPMNDIDAALVELDRAVTELHLRGLQIASPINDKPLDAPEFLPIYEKMARYNLPIWIHPERPVDFADYRSEDRSRYMIFHVFGWPYETMAAMTRLVFSGILEKFPNLKFITHHCGGGVPFFADRIIGAFDHAEVLRRAKYKVGLTKAPIDYFKMFYHDTAIYGNSPALSLGAWFCGVDRLVFGTDFPYDSQFGERYIRQTIAAVEEMDLTPADKKKVFEDNARGMLRLPI